MNKVMRKPIVAGNWKMNKTIEEAQDLVSKLRGHCDGLSGVEVVVCPPFTALQATSHALAGSSIHLGAQNVHWEPRGAYTGEISAEMLKDVGCEFVILGHSERRQLLGESNQGVSQKIAAVRSVGLTPIVCVGETLAEREANRTFSVIEEQLSGCLASWIPDPVDSLVIAYEPVWAIGTGRNATPEQASEVHAFIRNRLQDLFGEGVSSRMRILYGGSVNPKNIEALMAQLELDGTLVGGASLDAESLAHIVKSSIRTSHGI
jgi:triosephosphate isomerase